MKHLMIVLLYRLKRTQLKPALFRKNLTRGINSRGFQRGYLKIHQAKVVRSSKVDGLVSELHAQVPNFICENFTLRLMCRLLSIMQNDSSKRKFL
jgi:DNA topoisomerase IA